MIQKGTVLQTKEDTALVAVPRPSACGEHCASCSGGCKERGHYARVKNTAGAAPGDLVCISADDGAILRAACWLYGIPILCFFIGYWLGNMLFQQTTLSIVSAFIALAASFCLLKINDAKSAPKIEITKILMTDIEKRNQNHGI